MAALTRAGAVFGAAIALTFAATSSSAQIIYPGYPAYRYAARDAAVKFDVKPKETMVYVDGYYAGIVDDYDGAFHRLRTAPGGHEITLYLGGYRTYSERVYLSADNTFKFKHRMEKLGAGEVAERPPAPAPPPQYQPGPAGQLPPPGGRVRRGPTAPGFPPDLPNGAPLPGPPPTPDANARGTLQLTLQPADAEVLVDGSPWRGTASGERMTIDLSEGRHNIQIRKSGYVGYLTDVQIRGGQTTNLDVALKTQP